MKMILFNRFVVADKFINIVYCLYDKNGSMTYISAINLENFNMNNLNNKEEFVKEYKRIKKESHNAFHKKIFHRFEIRLKPEDRLLMEIFET